MHAPLRPTGGPHTLPSPHPAPSKGGWVCAFLISQVSPLPADQTWRGCSLSPLKAPPLISLSLDKSQR